MNTALIYYLVLANVIGFAIMGFDKWRAINNAWRVPEKTLLGIAAIGGAVGVLAGMRVFRHKTRKPLFSFGVPALILVHVALAGWLAAQ